MQDRRLGQGRIGQHLDMPTCAALRAVCLCTFFAGAVEHEAFEPHLQLRLIGGDYGRRRCGRQWSDRISVEILRSSWNHIACAIFSVVSLFRIQAHGTGSGFSHYGPGQKHRS